MTLRWKVVGLTAVLVALNLVAMRSPTANGWFSSSVPVDCTSTSPPVPRIVYRLNNSGPFNRTGLPTYEQRYTCNDREVLPPMQDVLGYTTHVDSNALKILFLGDSVGMQFSQAMQDIASVSNRTVYRISWEHYEGLHVAETLGGGVIAGWRITGMFLRKGENQPLPNQRGGGWVMEDATKLLNHTIISSGEAIGSFDVVVYRIPLGWLPPSAISRQEVQESMELIQEVFGARHIVIVGLPMSNAIQSEKDYRLLSEKNLMLQDMVESWNGPPMLSMLRFDTLVGQLIEWNAKLMGMDTRQPSYLFESLKDAFRPVAVVCSSRVAHGAMRDCPRNGFSVDGIHWCMNRLGGRVFAGLSCLMECAFGLDRATCDKQCNDEYMSVKPYKLS